MTSVSVLIPYGGPFQPERAQNGDFVVERWADAGFEDVKVAGSEPFSRAAALNAARSRATGDVLVVADADLAFGIGMGRQVRETVDIAAAAGCYAVPYSYLVYLSVETARSVRAGRLVIDGAPEEKSVGRTWGGCFAVPAALWDEVGGFDERFTEWGGEDVAFFYACSTLGPTPRRVFGPIYHLDHEQVPGWQESRDRNAPLVKEYWDALGDPDAMRGLIESARTVR